LFSLSGRAAAVIGPLVWTLMVYLSTPDRVLGRTIAGVFGIRDADLAGLPYKVAILSLAIMMLIGLFIFRKVPAPGNERHG
ncbi:MAG: hypothetical protein U9R56_02905, partial [candidate division Zixibacteria bacterium]|nr:hypothetical protein [candidate division Zixibacteria bacterium]